MSFTSFKLSNDDFSLLFSLVISLKASVSCLTSASCCYRNIKFKTCFKRDYSRNSKFRLSVKRVRQTFKYQVFHVQICTFGQQWEIQDLYCLLRRIYTETESNMHNCLFYPDQPCTYFSKNSDVGRICELKSMTKLLLTAHSSKYLQKAVTVFWGFNSSFWFCLLWITQSKKPILCLVETGALVYNTSIWIIKYNVRTHCHSPLTPEICFMFNLLWSLDLSTSDLVKKQGCILLKMFQISFLPFCEFAHLHYSFFPHPQS